MTHQPSCWLLCTTHSSDTDTEPGDWEGLEGGSLLLTQAWPSREDLAKVDEPHGMKNNVAYIASLRSRQGLLGDHLAGLSGLDHPRMDLSVRENTGSDPRLLSQRVHGFWHKVGYFFFGVQDLIGLLLNSF